MKLIRSPLILLSIIKIIINNCIKGENCPKNKGTCINNTCICDKLFATIPEKSHIITIYCNYEKINRFKPLILEFFFSFSRAFLL